MWEGDRCTRRMVHLSKFVWDENNKPIKKEIYLLLITCSNNYQDWNKVTRITLIILKPLCNFSQTQSLLNPKNSRTWLPDEQPDSNLSSSHRMWQDAKKWDSNSPLISLNYSHKCSVIIAPRYCASIPITPCRVMVIQPMNETQLSGQSPELYTVSD